jgi:hypothetical protein
MVKVEIIKGKDLSKKYKHLIAKENINNFDCCKTLEKELESQKDDLNSFWFFIKDRNKIVSFGLLKPVKIKYLGKIYNIFGIGNIISIEKGKSYGTILIKEIMAYVKKRNKTALAFTGSKVSRFYRKCGLEIEPKLKDRFFYDYGDSKTNKAEKGWWGVYIEGRDKFISKVLKTKSIVQIPCEHW